MRFGEFELDEANALLRRGGSTIALSLDKLLTQLSQGVDAPVLGRRARAYARLKINLS